MDMVARIRSFNRTVTRQIGALNGDYLGRHRSLGASRLLFEIGTEGVEIRELRARLGLDSGYTSRLLRSLEAEGLVHTGPAPEDARVRHVTLTRAGRKELAVLNRLSDEAAAARIEPLSPSQREALASAMETVERLLLSTEVRLEVQQPTSRDARYCLARYFEELAVRFDTGFDEGRAIPARAEEMTPPRGYFLVASVSGEPVGCGGIKCHATYGEIKRMWVKGASRGLGIGKRILHRLEELARERGLPVVRLETNKSLIEAQSLYRRMGYREIPAYNDEPYAHHWFEKRLDTDPSRTR
jgi:DNA-binding MarR family transcriptional regulator/N-acetylglutamate synthase-like GNAT family acetyltransferase